MASPEVVPVPANLKCAKGLVRWNIKRTPARVLPKWTLECIYYRARLSKTVPSGVFDIGAYRPPFMRGEN